MGEDGKRILYVDDEQGLAMLGEEFLGDLGYLVTSAYSGEQALDEFNQAEHPFDLVVTDESMPGMTGIELAQKIFAVSPKTPVILCSGHMLSMDEPGMDQANVVSVLIKTDVCTKLPDMLEAHL